MDEQTILRILANEYNQHWETGEVPRNRLASFRRRDFFALHDQIASNKVTSIVGPRRVGKTTIMFQLIDHLMKSGVGKNRIVYVSMDNAYLQTAADEVMNDVLQVYAKFALKEDYRNLKSRIYVLLDEIQYLENWQVKIKSWQDYGYKIKFIISGSSSVIMRKGASHMVGRVHERIVFPLKFSDMLDFGKSGNNFGEIGRKLREAMKRSIEEKKPSHIRKSIEDLSYELAKSEDYMDRTLQKFLIKGGYPELIENDDYASCSMELKDTILSKSILDIIERHKIRNVGFIKYVMALISSKSGSRLTHVGISQDVGVERPTIVSHMEFLEDAFLISKSSFYSKRLPVRERKEKKYYINDVGMRNSMVGMMSEDLLKDGMQLGIAAETLVHDHAKRLKFFLSGHQNAEIFYWDSGYGEVDMVLDSGVAIPIEVKFQSRVADSDASNLKQFMKVYKSPFGLIVTKNQLDIKGDILYVPLRIFLLMC